MKVSVCFTNFNRTDLLFDAVRNFIPDERVSEIVIYDDFSTIENYNTVAWFSKDIPKIKLFRGERNLDCYRAKNKAIEFATGEWCALLDSDNGFDSSYLDSALKNELNERTTYQPQFAKPHFDFRKYAGALVDQFNINQFIADATFQTMLNAFNMVVNRAEYLRVWDGSIDPVTSDSIFHNYNWLKAGNSIYIVPGMEYAHNVHSGSHYQQNVRRTPSGFHDSIIEKLKQMR